MTMARKGQGHLIEPPFLDLRPRLSNTRVHGGNLRMDVILAKLKYGAHHHADGTYDTFSEQLFSPTDSRWPMACGKVSDP